VQALANKQRESMRLTDKSRYFRLSMYYYERAGTATDAKHKARLLKMAAWYRDRALEIDDPKSKRGQVSARKKAKRN
jgi:hypothetical protein